MKHLYVGHLENCGLNTAISEVSLVLDSVRKNLLNQIPWAGYNYLPCVHFALAYCPGSIFLKYYVDEKFIRAANGDFNTAVCQDTCVEFFISFDDEQTYYNFEFNCIGTMLVGYGKTKADRELLPGVLISQIKYQAIINNDQPGNILHWELTVAIPFGVFCYHKLNSLDGKKCRANFYKCGDNLPIPHYVTWSNIKCPEPNFHLPEFFGTLQFV
jgi:Carbohydrate-binding family 9